MKKYILLYISILYASTTSFANPNNIGGWIVYFGNQGFKSKWNIHNEFQYRKPNSTTKNNSFLFRTGIGMNLSENNNNILLGYGFFQSATTLNESERIINQEHRIFQQFITKNNLGRAYFQHRLRFEERFFPDVFKFRFRYFLAINIPLNKPELNDNTIYFSCYEELFLNAQNKTFDQNRIYSGLGYFINKNLKGELGVLNINNTEKSQYILQFSIFNNIPF